MVGKDLVKAVIKAQKAIVPAAGYIGAEVIRNFFLKFDRTSNNEGGLFGKITVESCLADIASGGNVLDLNFGNGGLAKDPDRPFQNKIPSDIFDPHGILLSKEFASPHFECGTPI